jgi:hypothetical protein
MHQVCACIGLIQTDDSVFAHRLETVCTLSIDFNTATSYTLANAITGTYPDYAIDPSKMLVSRGALTPAAAGGGNIEF